VPHARVKAAFETAAVAMAPSLWTEPFGRTALEAFAGGAALIASRSGGFLEIAGEDGCCAILSDSTTPQRLAELLKGLVDNEATRDAYTRAARARGEARFSLAAQAEHMDRVLDGLRTNSKRVRAELDAV
jgi:glycosyltransferase involved in cell wall biosynthesis